MEEKRITVRSDPYEYGYGLRVMKEIKVCRSCGNMEDAAKYTCTQCGEKLPSQTIYQLYQKMHRKCALCDTVLASYMHFCPHCGTQIENK